MKVFALVVAMMTLAQDHSLAASSLPGGASSLQETYDDWRVNCAGKDGADVRCSFSQVQASANGQRVLSIELTPADSAKGAEGTLILPFGLLLDAGVGLRVDDGKPYDPRRFSTCLPAGCVVPLVLDQEMLASLRAGQKLTIQVKAADGGRDVEFPVSLKGFSLAFDRTRELLLPD